MKENKARDAWEAFYNRSFAKIMRENYPDNCIQYSKESFNAGFTACEVEMRKEIEEIFSLIRMWLGKDALWTIKDKLSTTCTELTDEK